MKIIKNTFTSIFTVAVILGFVFWVTDSFINAYIKVGYSPEETVETFVHDLSSESNVYSRLLAIILLFVLGIISYINRKQISCQVVLLNRLREDLEKTNSRLNQLLLKDALTGAINRNPFIEMLERTVAEAKKKSIKLALLFMDVEKFKKINDEYGHIIGDKALFYAVQFIKKNLRENDFIGRFGGDEFVACLYDIKSKDEITAIINGILESLSHKIEIDGKMVELKINIGVSIFPEDADGVTHLLSKSDNAMYKAKANNTFCEFV